MIVTLDETGYLHCAYLGTDPSMMVTPAPEARDINYEVSAADFFKLSSCQVVKFIWPRVRTGPGKSWHFILAFSRTGKSWKVLFRKGLLLQLLCIWGSWKNLSESWRSPGKLILKKDTNASTYA